MSTFEELYGSDLTMPFEMDFAMPLSDLAMPFDDLTMSSVSEMPFVFGMPDPMPLPSSEKRKLKEYEREMVCSNCKTTKSSFWRRDLCNACGLYVKKHNKDRPVAFNKYKRRSVHKKYGSLERLLSVKRGESIMVMLNWNEIQVLLKAVRQ